MKDRFRMFLFDVVISVVWIYLPMFYFGLRHSSLAGLWWVVDVVSLVGFLYWLHAFGKHSIYANS